MTKKNEHWILIRGLAREARHWSDFPEQLERGLKSAGIEARIDCIDLPGAGRFSEMKAPLTIAEMTEFVRGKYLEIRRQIRESGQTPPQMTRLVSISLGGMVASDWLQRWPTEFSGAVLMNTSFKGFSPAYRRLKPLAMKKLIKVIAMPDPLQRETEVLRLISNREDLVSKTAKEWARFADERPVTRENFARQLLAATLFKPAQTPPAAPILVLGSEKDRMVDQACSKTIARKWATDYETHETAGHDLTLDAPEWTVEKIVAWDLGLNEMPAV
ncbi:MAG: alpha/beta hydrolase [Proteobacteria bacterium]|nr:MAG: alpha/beta hydrolase [Pseudomonadota bacterium]